MTARRLLVLLILAATAAFVVGTTLERSSGESGHHLESGSTASPSADTRAAPPAPATPPPPATRRTGTTKEGSSGEAAHHSETAAASGSGAPPPTPTQEHPPTAPAPPAAGGESAAAHATETARPATGATGEAGHPELRPLGINVEAWPFIALVSLLALNLALVAWLYPDSPPRIALVVVIMLAFTALDIVEVSHQLDISNDSLALLAGGIAALHATATLVAGALAARARRSRGGRPGQADTVTA